MHVGYAPVFQNLGRKISDYETYRGALRSASPTARGLRALC
jgi:hypothetical protein